VHIDAAPSQMRLVCGTRVVAAVFKFCLLSLAVGWLAEPIHVRIHHENRAQQRRRHDEWIR